MPRRPSPRTPQLPRSTDANGASSCRPSRRSNDAAPRPLEPICQPSKLRTPSVLGQIRSDENIEQVFGRLEVEAENRGESCGLCERDRQSGRAALGVIAGLATTAWSFQRATAEARRERLSAEEAILQTLDMEIVIALKMTNEESPSVLPTQILNAALASVRHPDETTGVSGRGWRGRSRRTVGGSGVRCGGCSTAVCSMTTILSM